MFSRLLMPTWLNGGLFQPHTTWTLWAMPELKPCHVGRHGIISQLCIVVLEQQYMASSIKTNPMYYFFDWGIR
jgi:hypothetical protein